MILELVIEELEQRIRKVFQVFFWPVVCLWLALLIIIGLVQAADVGQPAIQAENSVGKEIRFSVTLTEMEFRTLQRVAEERNKRVSIDGLPPVTWQAVLHESVVERIQLLVRDQP